MDSPATDAERPAAGPAADGDGTAGAVSTSPSGTGPGERRHPSYLRELAQLVPDIARLLVAVTRDARVPLRAKLVAGATAAYLVSPLDLIPDAVPVAGQLDDLALAAWALRRLLQSAGYDLLRELWTGSDDGFVAVLVIAGIDQ